MKLASCSSCWEKKIWTLLSMIWTGYSTIIAILFDAARGNILERLWWQQVKPKYWCTTNIGHNGYLLVCVNEWMMDFLDFEVSGCYMEWGSPFIYSYFLCHSLTLAFLATRADFGNMITSRWLSIMRAVITNTWYW